MVWIGTLYRFGYELTTIGRSKEEVEKALIEAYTKAYIHENGINPSEDCRDEYHTYLENAREDITFTPMEYGKVEWL